MSTINLSFTSGELTSVDATVPWYASYALNGSYELSTAEAPGHYLVSVEATPGQNWHTEVDTQSFQSLYRTEQLLVFSGPTSVVAAPEISTWAMLLVGFALLAYKALDKRAKRARVRL